MPEVQPNFKWIARSINRDTMRRMLEELLHFNEASGSFMVIESEEVRHESVDKSVTALDVLRYNFFFTDESCSYLQAAWDGWSPEHWCVHLSANYVVSNHSHCSEMHCWNYVMKHDKD